LRLYDIRIAKTRTVVESYKIELVAIESAELSTGAKIGVALTVVISILIIAAVVGYVVRKFIQHRRELNEGKL